MRTHNAKEHGRYTSASHRICLLYEAPKHAATSDKVSSKKISWSNAEIDEQHSQSRIVCCSSSAQALNINNSISAQYVHTESCAGL